MAIDKEAMKAKAAEKKAAVNALIPQTSDELKTLLLAKVGVEAAVKKGKPNLEKQLISVTGKWDAALGALTSDTERQAWVMALVNVRAEKNLTPEGL